MGLFDWFGRKPKAPPAQPQGQVPQSPEGCSTCYVLLHRQRPTREDCDRALGHMCIRPPISYLAKHSPVGIMSSGLDGIFGEAVSQFAGAVRPHHSGATVEGVVVFDYVPKLAVLWVAPRDLELPWRATAAINPESDANVAEAVCELVAVQGVASNPLSILAFAPGTLLGAQMFTMKGDFARAQAAARKVIEVAACWPASWESRALRFLAYSWFLYDVDAALGTFGGPAQTSRVLESGGVEQHYVNGVGHVFKERYQEAVYAFEAAAELEPKHPLIRQALDTARDALRM